MTTCKELAGKIHVHLLRMEADASINKSGTGRARYFRPSAHGTTRVMVSYVSYQGHSTLTKAEAEKYLAWLDAGNNGKHHEGLNEAYARELADHAQRRDGR